MTWTKYRKNWLLLALTLVVQNYLFGSRRGNAAKKLSLGPPLRSRKGNLRPALPGEAAPASGVGANYSRFYGSGRVLELLL